MLEEINSRFNDELKTLTHENADYKIFNLGNPSNILLSTGIADKPIKLYGNKVIKKSDKHEYTPFAIKDLPKAIADPIAVFDDKAHSGYTILTEINLNGENALVALGIGKGHDINTNSIKTIFVKDNEKIAEWLSSDILLYGNKEKVRNYLRSHPSLIREQQITPDFTGNQR